MKDTAMNRIEKCGKFVGAAAYGFVHAPVWAVEGVRDHAKQKKKERRLKKYKKDLEVIAENGVKLGLFDADEAGNYVASSIERAEKYMGM